MLIKIHRGDNLPDQPLAGHGYAVATGEDTCDLWFVNRVGQIIKQVTTTGRQMMTIKDDAWDASTGAFPVSDTGDVYIVGTPGVIDGTYFPAGGMLVAVGPNPSTTTIAGSWFVNNPNQVGTGSTVITTTQNQTTFTLNDVFVADTLTFTYRGYTLNFNGDDMIVDGADVELPNLGFELEAGETVSFAYLQAIPTN